MTMDSGMIVMNMRLRQRGVTLLEMLLAIGIMGLVMVGAASLIDNHMERLRVAATAQQMTIFGNAVQAYIKDNYSDLMAGTNGVPPANATAPAVITTTILQSTPTGGTAKPTKYLPANFNPDNGYGQTICALVLQPNPGELYALVVTENIKTGATTINDLDLGLLAGSIGAAGGAIYAKDPTIARGTMGKWNFNLVTDVVGKFFQNTSAVHCDGKNGLITLSAGRPLMALWFSSDTSSAYLYRDAVPNHPELNTMQTDLEFKNDFTDPSTGKFTPGASLSLQIIRTVETECDKNPTGNGTPVLLGTLARDTFGNVLSCQTGVGGINYWKSMSSLYWGDPVENWAALIAIPCSTTQNSWQTRVVKFPTVGTGPRAYTCGLTPVSGGTWKWQPLAVDDKGALQLGTGYYIEGQSCNLPAQGLSIGSVAKDKTGQLLTCTSVTTSSGTSIVWKGSAAIGRYKFKIQGYNAPFVGTGHMSSAGQFSGTLYCDPTNNRNGHKYDPACGSGGTVQCAPSPGPGQVAAATAIGFKINSQQSCAYFFATHSQTTWGCLFGIAALCPPDLWNYTDAPLMVDVVNLPVNSAVQQW